MTANPLGAVRSLKLKFSIVIVAAVAGTAIVSQIGYRLGWPLWLRPIVAAAISLAFVLWLARGLTRPLRDMEAVARAMAAGDHGQRVHTDSRDEVGRLAGAFNSMAAEIADLDRDRRAFVANAAHELRTPVAGLQAAIENLLDGVTPTDDAALEHLHRQVRRLSRLVHDLLDLSRLEDPGTRLRVERVSGTGLVAAAAQDARQRHPGAEIVLQTGDDAELSLDPELVDRLVANLLDNAVLHGAAPVVVATSTEADRLHLDVTDAGPGFPSGDAGHLFEPFRRGDRVHRTSGSGLGLAIVRSIVELHGGSIRATSHPGACTVSVTIPDQPAT